MKKNTLKAAVVIGVLSILGAGMTVAAAATGRRANLKSTGNIDAVIEEKKIYISSADLRYLADEIDTLEDTYKSNTVDALNSIGTYFKADGTVVYDAGANEVDTPDKKTLLSFKNLKDAISSSQSVSSLSKTQATDKNGNKLYYADKAASDSNNLMKTTTTNTGYPVYYRAATAEYLSAGMAAWVNGTLIKGNGAVNAAYYNQGVSDGKQIAEADTRVGTATADKVLRGYTFTNSNASGIAGTMVDRGALNWNPTTATTYTVQPGYYSGGTLNSSGAYQAGGAAARVGTATADKVLSGYTFTNSNASGLTGTMANRGALNWNPTTATTYTVQPGYYSGGVLNSSNAYNAGYTKGIAEALNSSKVEYIYHTHSAACVEACEVYMKVLGNDGKVCTFYYEYKNAKYPKYPQSETYYNNYADNGGPGVGGTAPAGHYALDHTIYFCTAGSTQESTNTDTLTGKQDTSVIEGAKITLIP